MSEHELTTPASLLVAGKCDDATVLIVEDNEVNTLVAEYALMRFGLNTMHADSGAAAVDVMCTTGFRPELVLLDCQMPVMDGFEAARRIRAYEKANNLAASPLVALTANVFQRDRDKCRAAGMTAFLPKPFTDEQLRDVLLLFSIIPTPPEGRRSDSVYAALLL